MNSFFQFIWNLTTGSALIGIVALFIFPPGPAIAKKDPQLSDRDRAALKASLTQGYSIPAERYALLEQVPDDLLVQLDPLDGNLEYRFFDGTVYTIEPASRTVLSSLVFEEHA